MERIFLGAFGQVCIPTLKAVLASCLCRVCCLYDSTTHNYDITTPFIDDLQNHLSHKLTNSNTVNQQEYTARIHFECMKNLNYLASKDHLNRRVCILITRLILITYISRETNTYKCMEGTYANCKEKHFKNTTVP